MFLVCSCVNQGHTPKQQISGTYVGVIPCAECDGIMSIIAFEPNGEVEFMETTDDTTEVTFKTKGTWDMKGEMVIIEIGRDTLFFRQISSTQIMKMYRSKESQASFMDSYVLNRQEKVLL